MAAVQSQKIRRYADDLYQDAHDDMFSKPLIETIEKVLPPGVSQEDFDKAIAELIGLLGQSAVFTGSNLKEYVDPYEVPEADPDRKVPGAAVWYGPLSAITVLSCKSLTDSQPVFCGGGTSRPPDCKQVQDSSMDHFEGQEPWVRIREVTERMTTAY